MGQHRIGVRVNLSPAAERRFLQACKVQGGQTRFVEDAIEHYVKQLDMMEKLNSIENLLLQLVRSGQGVSPTVHDPATEITSETPSQKHEEVQQRKDAQNKRPDFMDPSQLDAAVNTLRAFMGGDDD